ncbi:MAG: VCBS repeat-containing protein [Deltaproteobacteria bacterium]|nr:VCBS repeat-containing protein [Deltaproteobacteria bacterium]
MKKNTLTEYLALFIFMLLLAPATAFSRENHLAVFPFEIHSQENLTYVCSGIAALLPSRVTVPGKITVIDAHALAQALGSRKAPGSLPAKISTAQGLSADYALTGSITKIGATISIDAMLTDLVDKDTRHPFSIQSTGLDDLIPKLTALAQQIKTIMIEGPPLTEYSPPASLPTAAPPATAPAPAARQTVTAPAAVQETPLLAPPAVRRQPAAYRPAGPLFQSAPKATLTVKGKPLHNFAVGDTNGDGTRELLIAGEEIIHIYTLSDGDFTLSHSIETILEETIVRIDVGDINGNGVDEIYLNSYDGQHANTAIIEYSDKAYKRISENQKWFFRIYRPTPAGGPELIGQQVDTAKPFAGVMYRFAWKDGAPVSRDEFIIPGSLGIYSFTQADLDEDGSDDYLAFNKGLFSTRFQLAILSYTGRVKWRDTQKLGGAPHSFVRIIGDDIEMSEELSLRLICEDINHDGKLDVIVGRNARKAKGLLKDLSDYTSGEVVCLNWDGAELVANWTSDSFEKHVADYILDDLDNNGTKELYVLSAQPKGMWGKFINTIAFYEQKK